MLKKFHCRMFGHPMPGDMGQFAAPLRQSIQPVDLPFIEAPCPRCGVSLPLHFLPGSRGTSTPAHIAAQLRWQANRGMDFDHAKRSVPSTPVWGEDTPLHFNMPPTRGRGRSAND